MKLFTKSLPGVAVSALVFGASSAMPTAALGEEPLAEMPDPERSGDTFLKYLDEWGVVRSRVVDRAGREVAEATLMLSQADAAGAGLQIDEALAERIDNLNRARSSATRIKVNIALDVERVSEAEEPESGSLDQADGAAPGPP